MSSRAGIGVGFAVDVKSSFPMGGTLCADPRPKPVAIDRVGLRDSGVTMAFDVLRPTLL